MIIELCASRCNLDEILKSAAALNYHVDDGYVHMAVTQSGGLPPDLLALPGIGAAVAEIAAIRGLVPVNLMINRLEPGARVPRHRDWIKRTPLQEFPAVIERWHLAVATNRDCSWWDVRGGDYRMPLGIWCGPVPYWLLHTVWNNGGEARVHLVVDLDTPSPIGSYDA